VARAFDKWAANSRFLKFLDVSKECDALGLNYGPPHTDPQSDHPHGGCPLAEIWVTTLVASSSTGSSRRLFSSVGSLDGVNVQGQAATGLAVATADPIARFTDSGSAPGTPFRYTNGQFAENADGSMRKVVETYGGILSFNAGSDICWYLDSYFCSGFHQLKQDFGSADDAKLFVYGWTLGLMAVGILGYSILLCNVFLRVTVDTEAEDDEDGDGHFTFRERCNAALRELSNWNPLILTLFIMLLLIPPLITVKIFAPCFDCYDFEAAALHEIGHFLGLGHPDNIPDNWQAYTASAYEQDARPTPGNNSYHAIIAADLLNGTRPDAARFCQDPWAEVQAGVPPGAKIDTKKLNARYPTRDAQMEAQTQHNPRACLQTDDLEALAVLYPDCGNYALFFPVCHLVNLHLGDTRMAFYILAPTIFALLFVIGCNSCIHAFEKREKERRDAKHRKSKLRLEASKDQHQKEAKKARALLRFSVAKQKVKGAGAVPPAGAYPEQVSCTVQK